MGVLAWVLLLIPAVFVWVRGRQLAPRKGESAFAELHFQKARQTGLVLGVVLGVVLVHSPRYLLLKLAVLLLAMSVADYPYRKALHGFSQGLGAHLSFSMRVTMALHGHWVLLVVIPACGELVEATTWLHGLEGWGLTTSVAVAVLALAAMHGTPWRFKSLVRSRPLMQPQLDAQFFPILQAAQCRIPEIRHFGPKQGFYLNAHALPSFYRPLVILSDDIINTLGPREVGAVFAHEVAHLEDATTRRRLFYEIGFAILTALAVAGVWATLRFQATLLPHFSWVWPMVLFVARNWIATSDQRQEHQSDLRGVELSGDPQISIDALSKIHLFNYLPRRWSGDEAGLSHPSLANRQRAIEEAAENRQLPAPPSTVLDDVTVRGVNDRGTVVVLGSDRLHWLSGVSPEAGVDPEAAHDLARQRRTLTYAELIDLRLVAKWGQRMWLTARAADGERRVRLDEADVGMVKERLDLIDRQLQGTAKENMPVGSEDSGKSFMLRLDGLLVAILGFFSPLTAAIVLSGLTVLVSPSRTALMMAGALAVGGQVIAVLQGDGLLSGDGFALSAGLLNILCLMLMGMLFLGAALRRYRLQVEEARWSLLLPFIVLGPVALVSLALGALRWSLPSPRWHVHVWAREIPLVIPVVLAMALALCCLRRPLARPLAAVLGVSGVLLALLASPWARQHWVHDPLALRGPAIALDGPAVVLVPQRQGVFEQWVGNVRWSPAGDRLALLGHGWGFGDGDGADYDDYDYSDYDYSDDDYSDDDYSDDDVVGVEDPDGTEGVGAGDAAAVSDGAASSVDGAPSVPTAEAEAGPRFRVELGNGHNLSVTALDVVFVDAEHLLGLTVEEGKTVLRIISLVPSSDAPPDIVLPWLEFPRLDWSPQAQRWHVVGTAVPQRPDDSETQWLMAFEGGLDGDFERRLRLPLPLSETQYFDWVQNRAGVLLLGRDGGEAEYSAWNLMLFGLLGYEGRVHFSWLPVDGTDTPLPMVSSALTAECPPPPTPSEPIVCWFDDGQTTTLWTVRPDGPSFDLVGHLEVETMKAVHSPVGFLLRTAQHELLQVDIRTASARRFRLGAAEGEDDESDSKEPDAASLGFFEQLLDEHFSGWWMPAELIAGDAGVALIQSDGETSEVQLYRLPETTRAPR